MKRGAKRRRKSTVIRLGRALWRQRWVRRIVWLTLAFIIVINLSVSYFGKSRAFFLSPFHLWDKTRALGFYAAHQIRRLSDPEMPSPRQVLRRSAKKHNVPPRLAFAIAKAESDFIPHRISPTGAMGMMQIMPDTAKELGIQDPFHPEQNADGGIRYLARLWRRYDGDIHRIVAAYNAGPGRVPRVGAYQVTPETRHYVNRVIQYSRQF